MSDCGTFVTLRRVKLGTDRRQMFKRAVRFSAHAGDAKSDYLCAVLVQIDWRTRLADMGVRRCRLYGAASTAFQMSGALRSLRNSLSRLNCSLWIRRNSSMPAIMMAAVLNHLNPSIGWMRSFTPR